MRPFTGPHTFVPGATRRIDPDTLLPEVDKKGHPLWDMPTPVCYVEHKKRHKHKHTGKVTEETIMVPVYQGMGARMANWYRGQARRAVRESEERKAQKLDIEKIVGDAVKEHDAEVQRRKESKDA